MLNYPDIVGPDTETESGPTGNYRDNVANGNLIQHSDSRVLFCAPQEILNFSQFSASPIVADHNDTNE